MSRGNGADGVRLPSAGEGYVRVDMELVAKAEGHPRGAQGRTRTTIQKLVDAGQCSHQPIASLTNLSKV